MKDLALRIREFLKKYAALTPAYAEGDGDADKYTSPDAFQMEYCAEMFEQERIPVQCWSEWGGGGYKPYSDKAGRELHDSLVKEIYTHINKK